MIGAFAGLVSGRQQASAVPAQDGAQAGSSAAIHAYTYSIA